MAHSLPTLKNAALRNMRNSLPRQCSNVISGKDCRFISIFKTHKYSTFVSMLVSLIQTFTPTLNQPPSKRLFFKRLVNQCHSKKNRQQPCCYHNSLPWTNDIQKRYYISTAGVAETGIGGFYNKNLAKISPLLKKPNIDFIAIHLNFPSRI
jgi:hypothetical protein